MENKDINDPLATLNNSVSNSRISFVDKYVPKEDLNYKDSKEKRGTSISREVWRPFPAVKPQNNSHIILRTRLGKYLHAVYYNDYFYRDKSDSRSVITDTVADWIPMPYKDLRKYMDIPLNRDIPLEIAFTWLLREKHELEDKLQKKAITGPYAEKAMKQLYSQFQSAESRNANLANEIKQLQDLIAQRNDELSDAERELTELRSQPKQITPRTIHIPRVNFLRLPHVGECTLYLIEPLLRRFNVIID